MKKCQPSALGSQEEPTSAPTTPLALTTLILFSFLTDLTSLSAPDYQTSHIQTLLRKTKSLSQQDSTFLEGRNAPAATDHAEAWPKGAIPCPGSSSRRVERSYSMFKVRRGGCEEITLVEGKEQRLHFVGAVVKRYQTSRVRETQVRW